MGAPASRASFVTPNALNLFLVLRMAVLALVVGAGIIIVQLSQSEFSVRPLYLLLVLSYVSGGLLYAGVRLGFNAVSGMWLMMVTDIAIETGIVHFSGGVASQFWLVICLSIIAAAFMLEVLGGLSIAILASLMYIAYGLLESRGMVTPYRINGDGSMPWFLEAYMHVSLFLLVGAVSGYLAERINSKGQQLQSARTELRQLQVDTDNILNNMSSGLLVINSGGKILTVNPKAEEILGIERERVLFKDAERSLRSLVPDLAGELLDALRNDQSRLRHEITVKRAGRADLPLGISTSILRDDDGERRGVIAVFQDLTEVREMQNMVRKADRLAAMGELSAGIAHELRNPLASISGSIEMLHNELKLSGENRRLMQLILMESDRLDRIISDFLEFAGLRPPAPAPVSLRRCLEDVAVLLEQNTSLKCAARVSVFCESGDIIVRFDEEQMKQVFLNLSINACEAMPGGGMLMIRIATADDGSATAAFLDEGPGITESARKRMFEPFFTTKDGGTGLGLAIANRIVEAHRGRIEVRNRDVAGAEFVVIFPPEAVSNTGVGSKEFSSVG